MWVNMTGATNFCFSSYLSSGRTWLQIRSRNSFPCCYLKTTNYFKLFITEKEGGLHACTEVPALPPNGIEHRNGSVLEHAIGVFRLRHC